MKDKIYSWFSLFSNLIELSMAFLCILNVIPLHMEPLMLGFKWGSCVMHLVPFHWKSFQAINDVQSTMVHMLMAEKILLFFSKNSRFFLPFTPAPSYQRIPFKISFNRLQTYRWPSKGRVRVTAQWTELPSHNIPAPDCTQTSFNRDNHHGNTFGGNMNMYNWTLPQVDTEQTCVMRMR